jgi:tetratricopeptide (TPR) repeat protein
MIHGTIIHRKMSFRGGGACRCLVLACVGWALMHGNSAMAQTSPPKGPPAFQDLARQAATVRDAGEIPAAIKLYEKAVRLHPSWQEGWWYLGSLEYDSSEYAQAATALRRLTSLNLKMSAAWALLGLSEFETHDLSPAFTHLQRARTLGNTPELANVTDYHLALLFNLRGEFEKARFLLSKLVLRDVNSEDLQIGLGLSLLRVPLLPAQLDPSKDALIHDAGTIAGFLALREGERADIAFRDLLKKYPSTPFAHYAYGAMLAGRGQEEAAEAQFQEESTITPESGLAYLEWAFLEFHAQRYATALPLAQNAVRLAPDSSMGHYLLGSILLGEGEIAASIPQLETARRLAPASPEVRYSLARAYAKAGRSEESRREQAEFTRLQSKAEAAERNKQAEAGPPTHDALPSGPQALTPAPPQ